MNRKQFTFYASFYKAIQRIKNKTARCAAYDAIASYALTGEMPDVSRLPDAAAAVFEIAQPVLDSSRKKAESGSKGGASKPQANASKAEANGKQVKEQEKEQEQMLKESKKEKRTLFKAPTVEEVAAYCRERKNGIDPSAFIDYYQQQKWKLSNGNPMSDWRAAVRNWEHRNKNDRPTVAKKSGTVYGGDTDPAVARAAYLKLCEELGEDPEVTV
jgi:hypothetical protein